MTGSDVTAIALELQIKALAKSKKLTLKDAHSVLMARSRKWASGVDLRPLDFHLQML